MVAVCDPVEAAAAALAKDFGIPDHFADLRSMLSQAHPDAVHVLTPPATHADVAIAALEAGAHVLVEKPMAIRPREAEAMVAAAERAGRRLAVDHNRWFDPVVQQANQMLIAGALGDLIGVEVFQGAAVDEIHGAVGGEMRHWSADLPGGVMHNLAPHPAYLLRNFMGPIEEIQVARVVEDGVIRELRALARGARTLGSLTISLRARPFTNTVRLLGTKAAVEVNLNNMTLVTRRQRQVPKLVGKVLPNLEEAVQLLTATVRNSIAFVAGRQRFYPGMGILIRRFYEHLANGTPAPTTAEEGREVVCLLDALWEDAPPPARSQASA